MIKQQRQAMPTARNDDSEQKGQETARAGNNSK